MNGVGDGPETGNGVESPMGNAKGGGSAFLADALRPGVAGWTAGEQEFSAGDLRTHDLPLGGTLIWYYYICPRQVWLIAHQLTPDQEDTNILLGRLIGETAYARERKELAVGSSKMDVYRLDEEGLLVGEVKKSSRYRHSARMQLAFYLKELAARGIKARGELRFPAERAREPVTLNAETLMELERAERAIRGLAYQEKPPPARKRRFCRRCAYGEFCWA